MIISHKAIECPKYDCEEVRYPNTILTLFDMGGGGMMAPKMFLTTVLKRLGGGSWNFLTFNSNPWSIRKVIFGSLDCSVLP